VRCGNGTPKLWGRIDVARRDKWKVESGAVD